MSSNGSIKQRYTKSVSLWARKSKRLPYFCKDFKPLTIEAIEIHTVAPLAQPIRIQEYGVGIFNHASTKSALKKALKKGFLTIDGKAASTATYIHGGETITLTTPLDIKTAKAPDVYLEILYEDSHLAAIVKPAGVLVSGNKFKTITNALPHHLKKSELEDACLPQPVHRLDFGTSGVLLCGKSQTSIRLLNKLFEHQETSKTYYAVTTGEMPDSGSISSEIDHKEALSLFEVVQRIPSEKYNGLNLVKLYPKTGRRHQLRKHLARIGHPVLGDQEYGLDHISSRVKGLHLHSFSLGFIHPFTKKEIYLEAPIAKRFKKLFPEAQY